MPTSKIHVSELRIGMYVSKLDKEWLDTPFLMQGFTIADPEDIEIVAEYSEFVWIDTERKAKASSVSSDVGTASYAPVKQYEYQTTIQEEHKRAYQSFRRSRQLTKSLLDDIRLGGAINTDVAKQTVDDCIKSILIHPDALMWMSKIREEREYTAEHCLNVCILAVAFGRALGLDELELRNLGLCGLLHDIGKMRVPLEILDKPDKLTPKEMNLMKAHTVHGRNLLLATSKIYDGTIDVAYSHHERIDGLGYPRKLSGAAISRFAKIISITDAYDAMTANRPYQTAKTTTEALKIIYNERGKQFDEKLAVQFIKVIGLFPAGSIVELYSGDVGIVVETNKKRRHLPKVLLVLSADKTARDKDKMLNLSLIESGELARDFLIKKVWPDGSFKITIKDYQDKGLVLKI